MFHVTVLNVSILFVLHLCSTSRFQFDVVWPSLMFSLFASGFCAICFVLCFLCLCCLSLVRMLSEALFLFVQSTNYCHVKKYGLGFQLKMCELGQMLGHFATVGWDLTGLIPAMSLIVSANNGSFFFFFFQF